MKSKNVQAKKLPDNPQPKKAAGPEAADGKQAAPVQDAEIVREDPRRKRRRRRIRALRSFLIRTVLLVLVVYILVFHSVGLTVMPRDDMTPRLDAGDLLLYYRINPEPKSRDIVVIDKAINTDYSANTAKKTEEPGTVRKVLNWLGFKDPDAPPTQQFVCRVIACPGDTVEITEERGLTVNGNSLIEMNIYSVTRPYEGYMEYPVKLGEGEYFVLSDSRNGGVDSRYFGVVKQEEIQGVVITILRRNNL